MRTQNQTKNEFNNGESLLLLVAPALVVLRRVRPDAPVLRRRPHQVLVPLPVYNSVGRVNSKSQREFVGCNSIKVVLYRDTGSVDPGSGPILGSVSGSEIHILGIAYAKDTFSLY